MLGQHHRSRPQSSAAQCHGISKKPKPPDDLQRVVGGLVNALRAAQECANIRNVGTLMIQDATEIATLQSDWQTVRKMRDEIKRLTAAHLGSAGGVLRLADYAHNLPVLLAFEVLRGVLQQLRAEGQFT